MKQLSILALLLLLAMPTWAQDAFQVTLSCQSDSAYILHIELSGALTGVAVLPSHTEAIEGYGDSLQLQIPLNNEWAEIRAIGINPAPIEMLALENLAACETGENEANQGEFVINALMQYAEAIQEWGE